ncbi:serine/threonine-protein kinase [Streptomyces naganishii]|uniref:Protein kinase domain-containing protein n=1 Tax=Streptomyces naganishii JCM 4654 TaxID=1306179 RepID=A0A919CTU7_9ACTN|nr:serine/threonine-protein kinase [Streptomyces naganishii]GHD86118.1 hypothetical protein GCM10010508_12890 [Streptomyces naganishii JCM 4654]
MSEGGRVGRVLPARPGDPSCVGPYRIIGRLGSGGMGTVYAGLDAGGLRVAVKVIHPAQAEDPEFRARFRWEVQLSARVQGPCLLPLLAADTEADAPWLATAYAPGPTLSGYLAEHGPLTGGTLYAFATGTAQALAAVHAAGVVHRDVKPQNVILTPAGPRVLDFGIARAADGTSVTRTGVMTGTPGWISPEYYRTSEAGPEGDLFAWGALVAYAATGRLPFGTGAPDVVAFRVLSGEPDLGEVPEAVREVVEKALAKDPAERITAESAAQECSRLLAAETTQVVAGAGGWEPTRVGELVAAEWEMPTLDDPAWHAPAPAPASAPVPDPAVGRAAGLAASRRRTVVTVLAVAAVLGAAAGGVMALPALGHGGGADRGAKAASGPATAGSPAAPVDGTARSASGASAAPRASAEPAGDPRSAAVPTDPLAGVPDPAYTRSADQDQPTDAEWAASARASDAGERDAALAIRDDMTSMLATKGMDFMTPTVTFNKRAQTVMVTGGPVSQIPEEDQEFFTRTGQAAACTALARRLGAAPTAWPYGRYAVYWKNFDGDTEAAVLGFGQATDGCYGAIAGQWQGDESGLAAARIPSTDRAEIRVADAIDKALGSAWKARVAEGSGVDPSAAQDDISLGFDPAEKATYVWIDDTYGDLVGRAQRADFQDVVTRTACRKLVAEYGSDKAWKYTRWSVAVYEGNSGQPEFTGSGDCVG